MVERGSSLEENPNSTDLLMGDVSDSPTGSLCLGDPSNNINSDDHDICYPFLVLLLCINYPIECSNL